MQRFLEVTAMDGLKIMLAVEKIRSIIEMDDGTVSIEMVENRKGAQDVIFCKDKYADIIAKINNVVNKKEKE